ncbi:MAG: hypothetical protein WD512_06105, partial [Candidatus Paceibacterota bacterium]
MNGIKLRKKALTLSCVINSLFSISSVKKSTSYLFKTLLIASFTVAIGLSDSYAQDRVEVTGTVTDAADGSPLPGASIVVL